MPLSLSNLDNSDYLLRLKEIKDKINKINIDSIKNNDKISIIGDIDSDNSNDNMLVKGNNTVSSSVIIPMDVLEENKEPQRLMSAVILQSKIRKIRLKRYANESEKIEKEKNIVIGNINDTNKILNKVDSQNCDWNLLSKRAQRSAVIKYCNDLKFIKGEMIKINKKVLTMLKTTLWEFIKQNPEFEIDYSNDEELIVDIDFLEVKENGFKIFGKEKNVLKEFNIPLEDTDSTVPKKRKIKLSVKKNTLSDLSHD